MSKATRAPHNSRRPLASRDVEPGIRGWVAAAIYFGLALVYFLPALMPGKHIYGTDYFAASYFFYDFISDRLSDGALPKWVPYVYGGLPLFSNPGTTYYPFRLLADLLLPTSKVFPLLFVIQFGLAGVGMFLLSLELGGRRWVAFLAGLAFQFTGLTMSYVFAGHEGRIIVATFAPLLFFFLHRGVRTGGVGAFVGAAATIAFCLLSFQIQSAYYLLLSGGLWAIFLLVRMRAWTEPRGLGKRLALGLGGVAVAFAIAAVNFLPFQSYVPESPRGSEEGRGYEFATSWSMAPAEITALAVPEHAGILEHYQGANPFKLHTEYVGALVVLLVLLGFVYNRRDANWWFFLGLAVFALTISFGAHTPLYRLYYEVLPGTKRFRAPSIAFFVTVFSLVSMAALTLERLAAARRDRLDARAGSPPGTGPAETALMVLGGLIVLVALIVGASAGDQPRDAAFARGMLRFAAFALLIGGSLWLWLRGGFGTRGLVAALAVLTVLDLWVIDRRFFETAPPPEQTFAADDVVRFLQSQPQPFRVWTLPFPPGGVYRGQVDSYLMHHGIEQAGGEHSNPLQRYYDYVGAGTQSYVDWHNFLQYPAFLAAANIRYLISGVPIDVPFFREVHRGSAIVYENLSALPRAWLAADAVVAREPDAALHAMQAPDFDPRRTVVLNQAAPSPLPADSLAGEAVVVEHTPDRVVVRTRANRAAMLVLADNYYEGWEADVDGGAAPVLRANHTFRAVPVPAGEHRVTFVFRPVALYRGLWIYIAGMLLLAAYGVWAWWRWRRDAKTAA